MHQLRAIRTILTLDNHISKAESFSSRIQLNRGKPGRRTVAIMLYIASAILSIFLVLGHQIGFITPVEQAFSLPFLFLCLILGTGVWFASKTFGYKAVLAFKLWGAISFLALMFEGIYSPVNNFAFHLIWYPLFLAALTFGAQKPWESWLGVTYYCITTVLMVVILVITPRPIDVREAMMWISSCVANGMLLFFLYQISREMQAKADIAFKLKIAEMQTTQHRQLMEQAETSRLEAELARQEAEAQKEAALEANSAKTQFLANMSHELRTPLNSIIGFTELMLLPNLPEHAKAKRQEYLYHIKSSGELLLGIINDVLDISKINSGKAPLEETHFTAEILVCDVAKSMASLANAKNQRLVSQKPDPNPHLLGDVRQLKQVLVNLIGNAIKFTKAGGKIIVYSEPMPTGEFVIHVSDNGVGIPKARHEAILKPFVQGDMSFQKEYEGTGLGLAIAKSVCDMHDIKLNIESAPDKGSCFSLVFPKSRTGEEGQVDLENVDDFFI